MLLAAQIYTNQTAAVWRSPQPRGLRGTLSEKHSSLKTQTPRICIFNEVLRSVSLTLYAKLTFAVVMETRPIPFERWIWRRFAWQLGVVKADGGGSWPDTVWQLVTEQALKSITQWVHVFLDSAKMLLRYDLNNKPAGEYPRFSIIPFFFFKDFLRGYFQGTPVLKSLRMKFMHLKDLVRTLIYTVLINLLP